MATIRLWAISIEQVRGVFAAPANLATVLAGDLGVAKTATVPAQPGLLGKLGPLLRRAPDAPVVGPDVPLSSDADRLLRGQFVPPDRLEASWRLLQHWLDKIAYGSHSLELTAPEWTSLDFDLARAGVSSTYGLRHLWDQDASLPLRALPGTSVGYQRHEVVHQFHDAWRTGLTSLDPGPSADVATDLVAWLGQIDQWSATAEQAGQPPLDLFAVVR